jgi:hypothetical protein
VVTRRALLAAGSSALLAGCGKDLADDAPVPPAEEALARGLEAERALAAALDGLPVRGDDRALVRRLAARSAERARRIAAAAGLAAAAPGGDAGGGDPAAAADRARAALAAHVEALPSLARGELRGLGTDLVVESAQDLAMIGAVFRLETVEAFPGTAA